MKHRLPTFLLLMFCLVSCAQVENSPPIQTPASKSYSTELVVPDVEIPWGMVFLPNGSLLYTEKEGKLIRFQYGEKNLAYLPVHALQRLNLILPIGCPKPEVFL